MQFINHGYGVVEFENAISLPPDVINEWLERRMTECPQDYVEMPDGTFVNQGGYTFTAEQIAEAPIRMLSLKASENDEDNRILESLVSAVGSCVTYYCTIYPTVKESLWWRSLPHVARYAPKAQMGFHHDNLVGVTEQSELATLNVLTAGLILDDRCEGGDLAFLYLEKKFKPRFGTCFLYPSGYIGTHAVEPIVSGNRVTYLEFFGHGSAAGACKFNRGNP